MDASPKSMILGFLVLILKLNKLQIDLNIMSIRTKNVRKRFLEIVTITPVENKHA